MSTEHGTVWDPIRNPEKLRSKSHRLRPLLEMDCSNEDREDLDAGEFVLRQTPLDHSPGHQLLRTLTRCGVVEVPRKVTDGGSYRKVYRWVPEARERLVEWIDTLSTLPCGCRGHIPPGRKDTPEGKMACKFCGTVHDRERFKEAL